MAETEPPSYYEPSIPFAQQGSDLRADVSRRIAEKLEGTPGLWRLCASRKQPIQLYVGDGFLNSETCRLMCEKVDEGSYPSPLYDKEKWEDVRTSYSCNLNVYDPLITAVEMRIAELLGIEKSWGEPLQG